MDKLELQIGVGDGLLIVDMQNDFLPGGALAIEAALAIIPVINNYIDQFDRHRLPIFASRDWHPLDHCSFRDFGGPWPIHCVSESQGAQITDELNLPRSAFIISKGTRREKDAYSAFDDTELKSLVNNHYVTRLFVCGVATDYCVLDSVLDAIKFGFEVVLLEDAIAAVNVSEDDGINAYRKMLDAGAAAASYKDIFLS